jgi:hypothetical protein
MKKEKLINDVLQGLLMAAAIAVGMPELSFAQDLNSSVGKVQTGISNIPQIVAGAAYIGGAALITAGALKLKAHSENPGQTPIGQGLGRLGAGAMLIALPTMGSWLQNTLNITGGSAREQTLGTVQ